MTEEESLFAEAVSLPEADRGAFFDRACAAQPELRARVEALLRAHQADGFMDGAREVDETMHSLSTALDWAHSLPERPGTLVGRYRLLQQIGEGGFGVVWMAEQLEPVTRRVALKVIRVGMNTKEAVARFEAERQALALMDHPSIAKVFDAGTTIQGRPYFVMELVNGIPITKFCDEQSLTNRQRLALFRDVCAAVNHAHQKGVIHRDIKPSNILVGLHCDNPLIKIIDFGIAKAAEGKLTNLTLFTHSEQFIGTPAYMSPEQTARSGVDIDTRSDIYSLGILLYELLTGRPPFDPQMLLSSGYDEMRRIIRESEPPKPSTSLGSLRGDQRNAVAGARKVAPEKLNRALEPDLDWIVMKAIEKDRTRRYETVNGLAQDVQRYLANEPVTAAAPGVAYLCRKFARRHRVPLGLAALIAAVLVVATVFSLWQANLAFAAKHETAGALREVQKKKVEVDRKNLELGALLAEAARSDRRVAEDELRAGNERKALAHLARACEYDPLSTFAAEKAVVALNLWQSHLPTTILAGHANFVRSAQFSPDGLRIVTASDDKTARVWDAASGRCLATLAGHDDVVGSAQFSPDGARIVTTSDDKTARLWDPTTGKCLAELATDKPRAGRQGRVISAQFNRDGSRIVTASWDTTQVWDAATGESLVTLVGQSLVSSAQFSPDGSRILTAYWDGTAGVWDIATGKNLATLAGHALRVSSAQFSRDGSFIVTSSNDHTARVWDAATGKCLTELAGHERPVISAAFSPDGARVVTASDDKTTRVWDATTGNSLATLAGHADVVRGVQFSPDGSRVVTASNDKTARVWDTATVNSFAILADDGHFVKVSQFSLEHIDTAARGNILSTLAEEGCTAEGARFSPDGSLIVTVSADKTARVWDAATGNRLATLVGHADVVGGVQFSPDGSRIVTMALDNTARVWDAATGKCLVTLAGHERPIVSTEFSPDGSRVVTASDDKTARVWDAATGNCLATLAGHELRVMNAQFSQDSARIVTASWDATARVWDVATGQHIATLAGHKLAVSSAEFSLEGSRIVTTSADGTTRNWTFLSTAAGPPPAWFADFLRFLAQISLNTDGELEPIKPADWLALRERLREIGRESAGQDLPYLRLLRRHVRE